MKRVVQILVLLHFIVVGTTIFHGLDNLLLGGPLEKPLAVYNSVNFAVWRYGFFSPDVGRSCEIEIKVHRKKGQVTTYNTRDGFRFFTSSTESANRFYGFKRHSAIEENLQDLAARSVAVRMANLHEDAWRVDYIMRSVGYPTLSDYAKGKPPRVAEFYRTSFVLDPAESSTASSPSSK